MDKQKIRVVILDDSAVFRHFLTRTLEPESDIELLYAFSDPLDALKRIDALKPDVLVVDMEMPQMRGNEFLRQALPKNPGAKAVVISSRSENVFDAMRAGAIDFVEKPGSNFTNAQFKDDLILKIHVAAKANERAIFSRAPLSTQQPLPQAPAMPVGLLGASPFSLIAIGASTGGTEAILEVVKNFPESTPGVVIVQHMPPVFTKMYADRLDKVCAMRVREAQDGDRVERGVILIAPGGDRQMRLTRDMKGYFIRLKLEDKVSGHCPSVDVLFDSVASAASTNAVGVLLTGMGADGAKGLLKMRQSGAYTFGQDEGSCIVYGMPKVAYDLGGVSKQLPLSAIGPAVLQRFRAGK